MEFNEIDLWAISELKDFLPKKIFDSHAHFYDSVFCPNISGRKENGCYNRKKITQKNYNAEQTKFYGENVQVRTNMIITPFDKVMSSDNEYRSMFTLWGDCGNETPVYSVLLVIFYYGMRAYGQDDINKKLFKIISGISLKDFLKIDLASRLPGCDEP